MKIKVKFWSYFRDCAGCPETEIELENGATLAQLHEAVCKQFPKLAGAKNSTLKAVGLEYQDDDFVLSNGDEVSFFPPVQGG
ncbi:MAG TPA: MoaD/ThiS family protein [Verrucomicrobiota bacterium]|nr:MoaD/ThiS family protein [Verrucomicrobiota bacterium]